MSQEDIVKRPKYFAGQYLLEDDFELEQNYHIDRQRRYTRLLTVSGIADGLEVTARDGQVYVNKGTAIAPDGTQIVWVADETPINLSSESVSSGTYTLSIGYSEVDSPEDLQEGSAEGYRRCLEQPVFSLKSPILDGYIPLAKLTVNGQRQFSCPNDSDSVRQYSGLRLPSSNGVSAPTLRSVGDSANDRVVLNGSLSIDKNLLVFGAGSTNAERNQKAVLETELTQKAADFQRVMEIAFEAAKSALLQAKEYDRIGSQTPFFIQDEFPRLTPTAEALVQTYSQYSSSFLQELNLANLTDLVTAATNAVSVANQQVVYLQRYGQSDHALFRVASSIVDQAQLALDSTTQAGEVTKTAQGIRNSKSMQVDSCCIRAQEQALVYETYASHSWKVRGIEAMRLTPTGNVGIGTPNPKSSLSVAGGVTIGSTYATSNTASNGQLIVQDKVGIGTNSPQTQLTVHTPNNYSGDVLRFASKQEPDLYYLKFKAIETPGIVRWSFDLKHNNSNKEYDDFLTFDRGKIGIGTTTPNSSLSVAGGVAIGSTYAISTNNKTVPSNGLIIEGKVSIGKDNPQESLEVNGFVKLGLNANLFALGGMEKLRVVQGRIDWIKITQTANGEVIEKGSGWSLKKLTSGNYLMTFTPTFTANPTILTVTAVQVNTDRLIQVMPVYSTINNYSCNIMTNDGVTDVAFTFIAIGLI